MKTITKRILTVSAGLMAGGAILGGIGFFMGGRPGVAINKYGINSSHTKSEAVVLEKTKLDSFSDATFTVDSYTDINVMASEDGNYYLEYKLDKGDGNPEYDVSNGQFTMQQTDFYVGFINIGFGTDALVPNTYINLYVPEDKELGTLNINNDSGDLSLDHVQFKDANIEVDYGDITVKDSKFDSMTLTLENCSFDLADSEIGQFYLHNEYDDNTFTNFTCKTATIELDSGDLYMDAAKLESLNCDSEYGNITLLLPEKLEKYTFDVSTEYGSIRLPGDAPRGHYSDRDESEEYYQTDGNGKNLITIQADSGDIEIKER